MDLFGKIKNVVVYVIGIQILFKINLGVLL